MEETVLILDVGKSRTKLNLVNGQGRIIAALSRTNRRLEHDGRLTLDTDGIADWLLPQLRELSRIAHVSAIVPVGHGAAAALISGDALIAPVLDYEAELPREIAHAYDEIRDPFEETLSPRLPGGLNLGAQLFWQDRICPAARDPGSRILLYPQYWAWWLSGERASEVTSLGCHTDMWRPRTCEFSSLAMDQGWNSRLPAMAHAGSVLGRLRSDIVRSTNLPGDCEILCGLHDSNAALHALRTTSTLLQSRFCVVSTGTWFVTMQVGAPTLPNLDQNFDVLANVDVGGRPVATARFMGGRDYESILASDVDSPPTPRGVFELIASGAQRLFEFDESGGNFGLPDQSALRGLDGSSKASLASLYLALNTDASLNHIGATGPVVVEGRFAQNQAFTEALAILRPSSSIYACSNSDGVAFGAARLRWPGLSPASSPERVVPQHLTKERYSRS